MITVEPGFDHLSKVYFYMKLQHRQAKPNYMLVEAVGP